MTDIGPKRPTDDLAWLQQEYQQASEAIERTTGARAKRARLDQIEAVVRLP